MKTFDIVVIGGGTAGMAAVLRCAELGQKPCLIEAGRWGGYCVNRGAYPVQAMLSATDGRQGAETANAARDGFRRGRDVAESLSVKWEETLKARKVEVVRGRATLRGAGEISVCGDDGELRLRAGKIILAPGVVPVSRPLLPLDGRLVLSAEEVFGEARDIPKQILILGGGKAGCEFATLFNRLGSRVFVLESSSRLLAGQDPDLTLALEEEMKRRKVKLLLHKKLVSVFKNDGILDITLEGDVKFSVDQVVAVDAYQANTRELGLAEAGVRTGEKQEILVDEWLQTSVAGVFAAGSVLGRGHDESLSAETGRIAAENVVGREERKPFRRERVPFLIYSDPEVASVGCCPADAHLQGYRVAEGVCDFAKLDHAGITGDSAGLVKIVIDKPTRKVIGAHILGTGATEMITLAALAIEKGLTVNDLAELTTGWSGRYQGIKRAARACIRYLAGKR
jgi:dihydrolipoamide dehydrogenase